MPTINKDNDPFFYSVTTPKGEIQLDGFELMAAAPGVSAGEQAQTADSEQIGKIAQAVRSVAQPQELAATLTDAQAFSLGMKVLIDIAQSGKVPAQP